MNECSGEIRALNTDLHTGDQHCPPTHVHSVREGKNLLKTFVWVGKWGEYGVRGFWGLLLDHRQWVDSDGLVL